MKLLGFFLWGICLWLCACTPEADPLPQTEPSINDFQLTSLIQSLDEPMELDFLTEDKIVFIERAGKVWLFDRNQHRLKTLAHIPVHDYFEDGLLGLAVDPNYPDAPYLYLFYAAPGEAARQHVSRFTLYGDSLIMASEKILLQIPTQRKTCCHSAGSLEFGPGGCLYIAVGDNTSPKASDGYSPLDERPGRQPFDAQRSAANSQDLRGKILRIIPHPHGTYTIPAGNLFPADGSKGRPEIYIMGCRNPFRIAVDPRRGWLLWGDVGPDARAPGAKGPQSYDEINLATSSGNFGWPYFVGPNAAYADYDFAADTLGPFFDPTHPHNQSPNNTGLQFLPPAQPAMISYGFQGQDSLLGKGGRSAMAGPVYYPEAYPPGRGRFPAYFTGKWLIYDWVRQWLLWLSLDESGQQTHLESFLPQGDISLTKPIDLVFGPDGALYGLAYGSNWFTPNDDAQLFRLAYKPEQLIPDYRIMTSPQTGELPLSLQLRAIGEERSDLQFQWIGGQSNKLMAQGQQAHIELTSPGLHHLRLRVVHPDGQIRSWQTSIVAGNQAPDIHLDLLGNRTFYWPGRDLAYKIEVHDPESGHITEEAIQARFGYLGPGLDWAWLQPAPQARKGALALQTQGCMACHRLAGPSGGPGFIQIAKRYADDPDALPHLAGKVALGGQGVWGERHMPAHAHLDDSTILHMVQYILSLQASVSGLPLQGKLKFPRQVDSRDFYGLSISAKDKGQGPAPARSAQLYHRFRPLQLEAEDFDAHSGVGKRRPSGTSREFVTHLKNGAWLRFDSLDLQGLKGLQILISCRTHGGSISLHLERPEGPRLGQVQVTSTGAVGKNGQVWKRFAMEWTPVHTTGNLFLVIRNPTVADQPLLEIDWLIFERVDSEAARPQGFSK